jgi:hypothetical protein
METWAVPSRFISLAILIYWSIAAFCLLTWDVIPELSLGSAPDLRTIAGSGDSTKPVRWSIQIVDDPRFPEVRRTVGESVTTSSRQRDGWVVLSSTVDIDAGGLLKGTPFVTRTSARVGVESLYRVDPSGNLGSFDLQVRSHEAADPLIKVKGQLKGDKMEIVSRGPLPLFNQNLSFEYEPRSVVRDLLGPLDRLPGLHVGQRWESRAINPFSGQVDSVRVEVARRALIHWEGDPVPTFEVVERMGPLTMRTWVRTDGVILRHEVPFPFVRLVLERRPDTDAVPTTLPTSVPSS